MYFELALNILLVVVLLPTLIYIVLLHRRLSSMRADREAVDAVVERMNEATRRAEASLKGIRQTAEQAKATLEEPVAHARALRDELSFLVQRADAAGERLAGGLSSAGAGAATAPHAPRGGDGAAAAKARPTARPAARPAGDRPAGPSERPADDADDVRSQAERDLMNALRNVR